MNKVWDHSTETFLKENVHQLTDEEISVQLTKTTGRKFTLHSVRRKRQRLGLKKVQGRGRCALTSDSFLNKVYPLN